jgi:NADPH:quinone reductase
VLIHAGAGGVGHLAVQLAKQAGAWVCTTVGSEAKAAFVRGLGADETILYHEKDFTQAVLDWSGGDGVELALDTVGGDTFTKTFPAVRFYGDLITLLQPGPATDWTVARQRNLRISYELMLTPMYFGLHEHQRRQAEILENCARLFDTGKLRVHVERCYPLAEVAQAHRALAQGVTGKLVLAID